MRARFFFSPLVIFARQILADVQWVYPPASSSTNLSMNIVMIEGDFKVIQWSNVSNPNNARISVVMFQLNATTSQALGDWEYLNQNAAPDTLSTTWTVNTLKNLTISPMFCLDLFFEGQTFPLSTSHTFNISAKANTMITSNPTGSTFSTMATISTSGSPALTSAPPATTRSSSTSSPSIVMVSSGLSTGGKVGIAIGVVGAAFLGFLAGWLILGRRTRMSNTQAATSTYPPVDTSQYEPVKTVPQQYPCEAGSESVPPERYELSPEMR